VEPAELAGRLASAGPEERAALLAVHITAVDIRLARALKALYDETESSDPSGAAAAATALADVARATDEREVGALAAWVTGMAALDAGRMEEAIGHLEDAEARFTALGQPHSAAATQVSKLIALAILGRYDEALRCGLQARDLFLEHGDILAAGKIEQNLGNIHFRRDRYDEAERYYRSAREHFIAVGNQKQLVQIANCLGTALTSQHKFRSAAPLYEEALHIAQQVGLAVSQADLEGNLGCLALFQGAYHEALDYLERSRRGFAALGMGIRSATAEQELADAYLELNLAPEAVSIYARIVPIFADLGMRAEHARALAYSARAHLLLGQIDVARSLLAEARLLYVAEGSPVGEALVALVEAQIHYDEGDYTAAGAVAAEVEGTLLAAGSWRGCLLARWLRGEAARHEGQADDARVLFEATLRDAEREAVPQIAQACHTSLGLVAFAADDTVEAERSFGRAVALIEEMRTPLPAEEFRTGFVADKLRPYTELVRLCVADGTPARLAEALAYAERARSRALVEMLAGTIESFPEPRDTFEAGLFARLNELREELNWFYSQINRHPEHGGTQRSDLAPTASTMQELRSAVRDCEAGIQEIIRQLQQRGRRTSASVEPLDVERLQRDIGAGTALVEYFSLEGELLAFVVTDAGIEVVQGFGSEDQVEAVLRQLRFQLDALRRGGLALQRHRDQLMLRTRHHLATLYDLLLRPIESQLHARRLVVVPYRALHYVPFHALYDGTSYVIERREVCYAPSATVLRHCLARPDRPLRRALLLGVPHGQAVRVGDEIRALAPLFPESVALVGEAATMDTLRAKAPLVDVLHLACHGLFRPDNPLFSSLRLADGWLTVGDAYRLDLDCGLIALSACETGMSKVAPGDELMGLARGFLSAGTPSLLVSLWEVDDEATATLMTHFYTRLRAGERPAAALRQAQCALLAQEPHPYFWSPFVLLGRW